MSIISSIAAAFVGFVIGYNLAFRAGQRAAVRHIQNRLENVFTIWSANKN